MINCVFTSQGENVLQGRLQYQGRNEDCSQRGADILREGQKM